jgi:hypothetical protein
MIFSDLTDDIYEISVLFLRLLKIVSETSPAKWLEMSKAGKDWWRAVASAEGLFRLTWARIEQCRPYLNVGIPKSFAHA